jgi:hypothetical protein
VDHLVQRLRWVIAHSDGWGVRANEETRKELAHVVEACSFTFVYLDFANFRLVFPYSNGPIFGAADEAWVPRVQIYLGYRVCVADEGTQNVVVVKRPVHDSIVRVPLASAQDAFVVVSEPYEVYSIILVVVCIYFLASLQIVESHWEILRSCDQILAIVGNVHWVDFFLKVLENQSGLIGLKKPVG